MAHRTPTKVSVRSPGPDSRPDSRIGQAIEERDRFLERHPQYRPLQDEIDRLLDKAGTPENRMSVLALLMESKLMELHSRLQGLNRILLLIQKH